MIKDVLIIVLWIFTEPKMYLDEKKQIVNEREDETT